MKMQMGKLLALLAIAVCLQLSGYATPKNDLRYKPPPFTYWLTYTYESNYVTNSLYIEYKSFTVHYSVPLPYNVDVSYTVYYEDSNTTPTQTVRIIPELKGATSTYLGYYTTYYQDSDTGYGSSLDIGLNYVQ
jgi:hypothetical protein